MIYLTTGGNGAGKTLFTLRDVRAQQLKENRPVYYHGFEAGDVLKKWGWLPFAPEKWQDLPDGSICIFDECQNEMPAKIQGELPQWINAIAQFRRKRGFDFWLITPHPSLIHLNVRRLIESPSWHRHIKRTMGADMASILKFNFAEMKCELPGAGARGQVSMSSFPKECYDWYKSASLHTGKKAIPKQVYFLAVAVLVIPALMYFAFQKVGNPGIKALDEKRSQSGLVTAAPGQAAPMHANMTAHEYLDSFTPRVNGLAYTAPRYDEITKPVHAPYPAACIVMSGRCECFTQQATRLPVQPATCLDIVKRGFFVDWEIKTGSENVIKTAQAATSPPSAPLDIPDHVLSVPVAPSTTTVAGLTTVLSPRESPSNAVTKNPVTPASVPGSRF